MAALHVSIQFPDNNNNISAQSTLVECGPLNEADHRFLQETSANMTPKFDYKAVLHSTLAPSEKEAWTVTRPK